MKKALLTFAVGSLIAGCAGDVSDDEGSSESMVSQACDGNFTATTAECDGAFKPRPSKHAIVLAHGFTAAATKGIWGFNNVVETLEADGHVVVAGDVAPFKPIAKRAEDLGRIVESARKTCAESPKCDPSKVHIIAHSMGGLDARYLISKLGFSDRVASLTTVASPHRGTAIADAALNFVKGKGVQKAVNALANLMGDIGDVDESLLDNSDVRGALLSISERYVGETFNKEACEPHCGSLGTDRDDDDTDVTYLSFAAISNIRGIPAPRENDVCEGTFRPKNDRRDHMNAPLVPIAPIVAHWTLEPNDGMATVESAKWGKFLGCIAADHIDQVGRGPTGLEPNEGGFDHLMFYRQIASRLDREVALHAKEKR